MWRSRRWKPEGLSRWTGGIGHEAERDNGPDGDGETLDGEGSIEELNDGGLWVQPTVVRCRAY